MLFALAFLPMFGIGGLTGLPLGLAPPDIHLHDTYYVIGHFHYVVAPGTIFALFAGIYYWFPKATGRKMNDLLGQIHFWGSFICINLVFMPMFIQGLGRYEPADVRWRRAVRAQRRPAQMERGDRVRRVGPRACSSFRSSSISSRASSGARSSIETRGKPPRSSGRRLRRPDTATS